MFASSEEEDELAEQAKIINQDQKFFIRKDEDLVDDELYYKPQQGEILNDDFQVIEQLGKGVYGNVIKATWLSHKAQVAIKVGKLLKN